MRTKLQSYEHILACLDNGSVNPALQENGCRYKNAAGIHCAVGCLMDPAQIRALTMLDTVGTGIAAALFELSSTGVPLETELTNSELAELQDTHDGEARMATYNRHLVGATRRYVEAKIKGLQ